MNIAFSGDIYLRMLTYFLRRYDQLYSANQITRSKLYSIPTVIITAAMSMIHMAIPSFGLALLFRKSPHTANGSSFIVEPFHRSMRPNIHTVPVGRGRMGIRIIVDGLPQHCFEEELIWLFARFGSVLSAQVARDHLHNVLGFVDMASADEAIRAVFALDGKVLHGHAMRVVVVTEALLGTA